MRRSSVLVALGAAFLSGFVVLATLLDTRIEFVRGFENDLLVVAFVRLQLVLGPLAILLFAFGVHWAATRRFGRALLALPALPVWSLVLIELPTFSGNSTWTAIFLAHSFRGLEPFGAPPS